VHREWLQQRRRILTAWQRLNLTLNPYHHYVLSAEKQLFTSPRLKAVVCNSHMVKQEIRKWFGVPEERLHVIYSGIDSSAFAPLDHEARAAFRRSRGMPVEAFVFLFVGSGFGRKGLANAIQALAQLPRNCHLWVLGEDRFLSRHEKLAASLGLGYRVRFMGGQTDVKPWYGAADAFVLPTHYDPFPNAALEAWASGLPVITSSKSGAAELVREGVNGHVRDALDIEGLAEAMQSTLARGPGADQNAARETVSRLTPDAMAEQLVSLYRELLAGGPPRALPA
jgi:UDP-glucose:(heptosyl)LPS alpha-1,3-glucosyltransferase